MKNIEAFLALVILAGILGFLAVIAARINEIALLLEAAK